jgi:hypothetical protein
MESANELQIRRIREMSPDQKIRIAHALWVEARNVTAAGVKGRHPDWPKDLVAQRVRELMSDAGS